MLTVDVNPDPYTFSWYKNELELLSTERVMFGVNYIKFMPASLTDSGMYTVTATNNEGTDTTSFKLEILCKLTACVHRSIYYYT